MLEGLGWRVFRSHGKHRMSLAQLSSVEVDTHSYTLSRALFYYAIASKSSNCGEICNYDITIAMIT